MVELGGVEGVNEVMDDYEVEINLVNLMGKNMNIAGAGASAGGDGGGVDEKALEDELATLEVEMNKEKEEENPMPEFPIPPTAKPVVPLVANDAPNAEKEEEGKDEEEEEVVIDIPSSTIPVSKIPSGSKLLLSPAGKANLGPPVRVALPS